MLYSSATGLFHIVPPTVLDRYGVCGDCSYVGD